MKQIEQVGLFDENSRHARFLELLVRNDTNSETVKQVLTQLLNYADSVEGLYLQFAFGSDYWDTLNPSWRPKDLLSFSELSAGELNMPSSQGDILIWLHSADSELIPQTLVLIYPTLEAVADIQLDLEGIKNKESRDLIGFVDGTANPKDNQRIAAALIPTEELGAGGSYVISQRWQHDLTAFNQLSIHAQEKVVGRTKIDDIELEGDDMPVDSHVSRTDAKVDGKSMKIYRRSSPYMSSQFGKNIKPDHGLYFLAFASEMQRFTVQLDRMMGLSSDGVSDKLMKYSAAKTGSYWFMPSLIDLTNVLKVD
jgi:putative iron-dependent peroxidase